MAQLARPDHRITAGVPRNAFGDDKEQCDPFLRKMYQERNTAIINDAYS